MTAARLCAWCLGPIPERSRRDAVTCSKRCRQARHRFVTEVGTGSPVAGGHPRRLAYADPPYPGKSARYYGTHPDYAGEVDHAELIASLSAEYDAWALSTSAEALQDVLALCPPGARVASWVRGERANKHAQTPVNAWEPVIYAGAFRRPALERRVAPAGDIGEASCHPGGDASADAGVTQRVDALVYAARPRMTDPHRVVGAKPARFCRWVFELLGATPDDTFVDVFPGSGGVARAWEVFAAEASRGSARRVAEDLSDASCSTSGATA